jgi:hypothetical protein
MRSENLTVRVAILLSLALVGSHRAGVASAGTDPGAVAVAQDSRADSRLSAAVPEEVERALLEASREDLAKGSDGADAGAGIGSGSNRPDSAREDAAGPGALSVTEQLLRLLPAEREEIAEILDSKVEESLSRYVVTRREGDTFLFGYLDTHRVRTVSESLLITLTPSGEVRHVLVLAFAEPPEYRPAPVWYAQFRGLEPESRLKYGREIDAVTGATLTGRATVDAVSRVRKIHQWLLDQEVR